MWDSENHLLARHLHYPQTPTSLWEPGKSVVERTLLRLPEGLPAGQWSLKVAMLDPRNAAAPIQLGIAGCDSEKRYLLCAPRSGSEQCFGRNRLS